MNISVTHVWWKHLEQLRYFLYGCFLFFMPFTQALTFNIGFPLKFSELALLLLSALYLVFNRQVQLPRPIVFLIAAFFFVVTLSLIVNLFWSYPYSLRTYESRFGYTGDSISRYIYFILALLAFVISIDIYLTDTSKFIRIWIYGAMAAAAYAWYLAIFSFLKLPVFFLPGMKEVPQTIFGGVIRSGTFAEGNFMGLFLFLSGVMSFYVKKFKTGVFLFASVFTTFATLSIISIFLFLVLYLRHYIFRKRYIPYFIIGLLLSIPALYLFSQTKMYNNYIHEKIFGRSDQITSEATYSKVDRLNSIKVAFRTAVNNPVLGVGPSNFGRHYDQYYIKGNLTDADYQSLLRKNEKVIPNNVYLEVWAEYGSIGFFILILFLLHLLHYAHYSKELFPGMLCMLICYIAYPSFIMIYLWAFMALPVANYIKVKRGVSFS